MANEKRLIDANALLELVQFRLPIDNRNAEVIAGCVDITRRLVENSPTVDAVEVVHGSWRKTYTCSGEWPWGYECDQCKADNPRASYYCPNCGAKMDGADP